MVANDEWGHAGPISLACVRHLDSPSNGAVAGVERYQVTIRYQEVQPVLVHAQAATANVESLVGRVGVMPKLLARERVDRPDIVGDGEVQHTINQQRGGFDGRLLVGLKGPGKAQAAHILWRYLFQLA